MMRLSTIERKCMLKVVTKKLKQGLWMLIQVFDPNPYTVDFSAEFKMGVFSKHHTAFNMSCIT